MTSLNLVEGLPKYEKINEAKAIAEALRTMKRGLDGKRERHLQIRTFTAKNKAHFMKLLERKTDYLHISAHGDRVDGETCLFITRNATITTKDIAKLKVKAKIVFMNACLTSRKDIANAFFKAGVDNTLYFIAPHQEVSFDEAFLVSLLFYRKAFLQRTPLSDSKQIFKALEYAYKLKDITTKYWFWQSNNAN